MEITWRNSAYAETAASWTRDPGRLSTGHVREARRVLEVSVLEPEGRGPLIHLLDEVVHAGLASSAAEALGKGISSVVAGEDKGRREELPHAYNGASQEADVAVEGCREGGGVRGDGDLPGVRLPRLRLLQGTSATMILSVEPIGSLSEASSPARYSPLPRLVSAHTRAATTPAQPPWARRSPPAPTRGGATHCKMGERGDELWDVARGSDHGTIRGYERSGPATRPAEVDIIVWAVVRSLKSRR